MEKRTNIGQPFGVVNVWPGTVMEKRKKEKVESIIILRYFLTRYCLGKVSQESKIV